MVNVWVFYRISGGLFNPAVSPILTLKYTKEDQSADFLPSGNTGAPPDQSHCESSLATYTLLVPDLKPCPISQAFHRSIDTD